MDRKTFAVPGMSCDGCERTVESALRALSGVTRAEADHEAGTVEVVVEADVADGDARAAVEDAGYDVVA